MSVCCVLQSSGIVATGSDVTPDAIAWNNINAIGSGAANPIGTSNTQSVTAIDTPITLRATFTNVGATARITWVKNGVEVGYGGSPLDVLVSVTNTLALKVKFLSIVDTSLAATGTITVTNVSDGGATLDTLDYYIERL